MNIKIAPTIESIKANFWFVPSLMIFLTLLMSALTITIDIYATAVDEHYFPIIYAGDIDAIRSLLTTIAASMITVTSIAFSITIVSLTLASSQFGPRLMRNFMKDRITQIVLGVFISNFIYCLVIFCAISFDKPYQFTPGACVIWAIIMTFISVIFLIHFIHHVAKSIQADTVVDDVYNELKKSIMLLFPSSSRSVDNTSKQHEITFESTIKNINEIPIRASHSGYVQFVDVDALLSKLKIWNIHLTLDVAAGDYVVEGSLFASAYSEVPLDGQKTNEIETHIVLGPTRTPVQDPEFAVHQLVEIALRALSPGINDPYTATTCIDKLCSILCKLVYKSLPSPIKLDEDELARLKCKTLSFTDIGKAAFDQIRQHAQTDTAVTLKLLESLKQLAIQHQTTEQHDFVLKQLDMIATQQKKRDLPASDEHEISTYMSDITRLI